jgi:putative endopeptidase
MRLFAFALAGSLLLAGPIHAGLAFTGPTDSKPASPNPKLGFDPANVDAKCKPCEDFNRYANGGWLDRTPIPAGYPEWDGFSELAERNQKQLTDILDAAKNAKSEAGSVEQKIGDFYASAMDEAKIEAAGIAPLKDDFERIAAVTDVASLGAVFTHFQMNGVRTPFGFFSGQDFKNSAEVIGQAAQGGLGLPERDYYFKDDEKSKTIRAEYVKHVAKMFELLGDDAAAAARNAETVMRLETKLAEASMTNVEMRDPNAVYNRLSRAELKALTPNFQWDAHFRALGVPNVQDVNVAQPKFFKSLSEQMTATSVADWKTYLRWCVTDSMADYLPAKFVNQNFAFYGTVLSGTKEQRPRFKRMTRLTDQVLGEALGQVYVKRHFSPETKVKVQAMLENIKAALRDDIGRLDWMSDATRKEALAKLNTIVNKIGYPDKWIDYSSVVIGRESFVENIRACSRFAVRRDLSQIGKPVDRAQWGMTPPTVNAYYNPSLNEIVFPAGILQPPFFNPDADDAVNYGGIGAVIGHEITHGFDDEGRQFDKDGNLREWWTEQDRKNFTERAQCVNKQFSGYKVGDLNVNGDLVLGEAIADLGGLTLAHFAYQKSLGGKPAPVIDGFTADQRFFMGWAQVWRTNATPEYLRLQVTTDPHPAARFRINGTVSNMEIFARAFGCKNGDPMARAAGCRIW